MFNDELEPRKRSQSIKNLEPMSLDELEEYIVELKKEIVRTEDEIEKKKKTMDAASSFFK